MPESPQAPAVSNAVQRPLPDGPERVERGLSVADGLAAEGAQQVALVHRGERLGRRARVHTLDRAVVQRALDALSGEHDEALYEAVVERLDLLVVAGGVRHRPDQRAVLRPEVDDRLEA